jgi:hypothetical protein
MGKHALLLLLAAGVTNCSGSDVREVLTYGEGAGALRIGEVCIPPDEAFPEFAGFSVGEVNVTMFDPQCASGVCLAHDFQGRVTCPDGNLGQGEECFTPAGEQVSVDVRPHAPRTRPKDHVYCSCRCGGPRELAPFCDCPSGMKCDQLVPYEGVAAPFSGAGAYCVKD